MQGEIGINEFTIGKGPFLYYVRVEGWVGGIAKYILITYYSLQG